MASDRQKIGSKFYILLTTLLCGGILVAYAAQLTVVINGDETITMANSAYATGRDWSLLIAQVGGRYYRYLQALMAVPFFERLSDPQQIYRAVMILQALIQASTVPVVYLICKRHLKMKSTSLACLLSAAVCFVPSIVLYAFYFRGDYLLPVLPWYALLFLLESMRAAKEEKRSRRVIFTLLVALCCILAYAAHTRGIILIIAVCLTALVIQLFTKKKSLHWPVFVICVAALALIDLQITGVLEQALYSISGLTGNSFETSNVASYFNLFSYDSIKSFFMLCISWLNTLITTTEGLVLIGAIAVIAVVVLLIRKKIPDITDEEKLTGLFSFLVFAGYFAVGALYFRSVYYNLATESVTRRVDRLIYDRYSVCGAGMLIFVALYVLICHREWFGKAAKAVTAAVAVAVFGIFMWKGMPLIVKNNGRGFVRNTITLNTFASVDESTNTVSRYDSTALLYAFILGLVMLAVVLVLCSFKKKRMPYVLLSFVLICDLFLIQVNYVKARKSMNDYVIEETEEVVKFLSGIDEGIVEEYPYVLKGGLSGSSLQYYQPQLLDYVFFGTEQEENLDLADYFIVSENEDIDLTWYEDDYYLFEDYDYDGAQYDIVYVKGDALAKALDDAGYGMVPIDLPETVG